MLRALQGGCQVPIGVTSQVQEATLTLRGVVLQPDGTRRVEHAFTGPLADAESLGNKLASELLGRGARALLT